MCVEMEGGRQRTKSDYIPQKSLKHTYPAKIQNLASPNDDLSYVNKLLIILAFNMCNAIFEQNQAMTDFRRIFHKHKCIHAEKSSSYLQKYSLLNSCHSLYLRNFSRKICEIIWIFTLWILGCKRRTEF